MSITSSVKPGVLQVARAAGLSVVLLISACSGDERPFTEAVEVAQSDIGRIDVSVLDGTLTPVSVAVGGQLQLGITSFTTAGVQTDLDTEDRDWSVSDTNVATINRDGLLTGLANGEVDVNFALGSLQAASLTVTVSSAGLDGLAFIDGDTDPDACLGSNYAAVGSFGELERVLTDVVWSLDVPGAGELIEQPSTPGAITLVANAPGTTSITANSAGFSQTLDLVVADTLMGLSFGTGNATISNDDFARGVLTGTEEGQVTVEAFCGDFRTLGQVVLITSDDDNDASDELSFEQNSPVTIGVAGSLQLSVSTGSTYDEDDDVSDDVTWQSRFSRSCEPLFRTHFAPCQCCCLLPPLMTVLSAVAALRDDLQTTVIGQERLVERLLIALLVDGHLLVEGAPGLAKTRAIKALAERLEADYQRVQFTPDLLPADLTGTEVYRPQDASFVFQPGPLFNHLVLADEINREGTYPLPEAQLDRFLLHVRVGYPDVSREGEILRLVRREARMAAAIGGHAGKAVGRRQADAPLPASQLRLQTLFAARREVLDVHMAENVEDYIVRLVTTSRVTDESDNTLGRWIDYGASPRATLALDSAARPARRWTSSCNCAVKRWP